MALTAEERARLLAIYRDEHSRVVHRPPGTPREDSQAILARVLQRANLSNMPTGEEMLAVFNEINSEAAMLPMIARRVEEAMQKVVAAMRERQSASLEALAISLGVECGPPILDALGMYGDTTKLWAEMQPGLDMIRKAS